MVDPREVPAVAHKGRSRRSFLIGAGAAIVAAGIAGFSILTDEPAMVADASVHTMPQPKPAGAPDKVKADPVPIPRDVQEAAKGAVSPFRSVTIIGDSITEASKIPLEAVLSARGVVTTVIDAVASRRIEVGASPDTPQSGKRALTQLLKKHPDPEAWVIALGTNDVGSFNDAADYGRLIDLLLAPLPLDAPVVWVDVYRPEFIDQTDVFNQVLARRLARRGKAVVADWHALAADPDLKILRSDRVHPNEYGTVLFAALVGDALAELQRA